MKVSQEQLRQLETFYNNIDTSSFTKSVFTKAQRREIYSKIAADYASMTMEKYKESRLIYDFSQFSCDNLGYTLDRICGKRFKWTSGHIDRTVDLLFPEFVLFRANKELGDVNDNGLGWWETNTNEGLAIRAGVFTICAEMCK